ncbi:MAG: divalent-cation tolerance protein CutA [Bryobacterales bacterium]|nr:divalent-cation tolerance protein CutA [Bryobacterales bacterium]
MTDKIIVLTTCDSEAEAQEIALYLVERRVSACVNILPGARSIYRSKDRIKDSTECLLVIKSRRDLFPALRAEIEKVHSYKVPEIIALQIVDGAEPYLSWLDSELTKPES